MPTTSDSTCAWLNTRVACAWSRAARRRATTSVVVPTPSICVAARTMKVRLPLMPTAATAVGAQTADPIQIDQDVKRLEDHADQHEAGRSSEDARSAIRW